MKFVTFFHFLRDFCIFSLSSLRKWQLVWKWSFFNRYLLTVIYRSCLSKWMDKIKYKLNLTRFFFTDPLKNGGIASLRWDFLKNLWRKRCQSYLLFNSVHPLTYSIASIRSTNLSKISLECVGKLAILIWLSFCLP